MKRKQKYGNTFHFNKNKTKRKKTHKIEYSAIDEKDEKDRKGKEKNEEKISENNKIKRSNQKKKKTDAYLIPFSRLISN